MSQPKFFGSPIIYGTGEAMGTRLPTVSGFSSQKWRQARQPRWEIRHETVLRRECKPSPNPTRVLRARGAPSELLTSPAIVLWFKSGAE